MSLIFFASVRALQEDAVAAGRARPGRIPDAADAQERIIGQLVAFIPAEPVTLFIAVLAAVGAESSVWVRWTLLGVVAVLAPLWVEIHYLQKARSRRARKKSRCSRWSRERSLSRPGRPRCRTRPGARSATSPRAGGCSSPW